MLHLPPRIFGCACYVQVLSPVGEKLDPKSIKCVFMDYSHTQKGYKCYFPTLCHHFVNDDATSLEST
jgi:hypothetical protein